MAGILIISGDFTLGQKVRMLRVARRWRQIDLATMAGVQPSAVSALERDCRMYPGDKLRILESLGLDMDDE